MGFEVSAKITIFAQTFRSPPIIITHIGMNNLVTRAMTGIVYVAAIVTAVIYGGAWLTALMAIFGFFALHEFLTLTNAANGGERRETLWLDLVGGVVLIAAAGLTVPASVWLMGLTGLYLLARPVVQLYTREEKPILNLALTYMGLGYICLPLCLLLLMRSSLFNGEFFVLAMFVMIWLSDTGAYCVGSLIGRHKLFPRISPAKSIEGFAGGVVFAIAAGVVARICWPEAFGQFSVVAMGGMGLVVAVFSTWGDLVESLIKRSLGVKDSGNILPGHGGMLDRIDSLLLAAPATAIYLFVVSYFA